METPTVQTLFTAAVALSSFVMLWKAVKTIYDAYHQKDKRNEDRGPQ